MTIKTKFNIGDRVCAVDEFCKIRSFVIESIKIEATRNKKNNLAEPYIVYLGQGENWREFDLHGNYLDAVSVANIKTNKDKEVK